MPFPTFPLSPVDLCPLNSIRAPQHVLTFKLMWLVLLQLKQQGQRSLYTVSSHLHIQKLLDMKVKRAEGNSFHFLLRTCRKICCLLTVVIEYHCSSANHCRQFDALCIICTWSFWDFSPIKVKLSTHGLFGTLGIYQNQRLLWVKIWIQTIWWK